MAKDKKEKAPVAFDDCVVPCPQAAVCSRRIIIQGERVICSGNLTFDGKKPCESEA